MKMSNYCSSWIDYEYKFFYQGAQKSGLRINYDSKINEELKMELRTYINFLRKRYYFPIRCYVHIKNVPYYSSKRKKRCYGVFFSAEENRSKLPSIYLAAKLSNKNEIEDILYNLTRLLTYYFQWFFFSTEKRTNRSLETEATRYANYLTSEFLINNIMSNKNDNDGE